MKISYLSGIEKCEYIEKVSINGNIPDAPTYIERASNLYSSAVPPQEIDYPVYEVSKDGGFVTVTLSDARNPYVENWLILNLFTDLFLMKKMENTRFMRVSRGGK